MSTHTTPPTSGDGFAILSTGIADLADQNPVQAGRVTPHLTFAGDSLRIRHLALDTGAVLPEHSAPRPVVITVVAGEVLFTIGEDTHRLSVGAVLYMDDGVPHSVEAVVESRLTLTLVA